MSLFIYNSIKHEKELFVPLVAKKVSMYVCGMTVYDYCHIGHARVMVVFDMIYRYLKHIGYQVNYIRNITDIDDKIIKRANELEISTQALTEKYIQAMQEDEAALNVLQPNLTPKATLEIDNMLTMIQTLIDKDYAYLADNGDVYYSVEKFAEYGKLSGKHLEELRAGERVEIETAKSNPLDFVLWKKAKPEEPSWDSPWGKGRPGWHIECSAMSTHYLGPHFDIHGGGHDLQFPHHENEIAQSEACYGKPYARYWMHNGFVKVNEEKMSKSLGNFFTIRDVLKYYHPEVIRYFILSSHYRSPLNYSDEQLNKAQQALTTLYSTLREVDTITDATLGQTYRERFMRAMNDDFNTPLALSILFEIAHDINKVKAVNSMQAAALGCELSQLGAVLGLLQNNPEAFLQGGGQSETQGLSGEEIEALIEQRNQARQAKNFAEADRIRNLLKENKIILEDKSGATLWRRE